MASRLYDQGLAEDIKCPICLDFFTDPVTLECGHNFCRFCITRSWDKQQINFCAVCQEMFPERKLGVNWALVSLAEKARKLSLSSTETETKRKCEKHREELKLFCETDKKLICSICRDAREHRDHSFLPIDEAAETYKHQVRSSLASLTQRKETAVQAEVRQREKISQVKEQMSSLQTHVMAEFAKMHQSLTNREQLVMGDLTQREKEILDQMETNLQEIQENLDSVTHEISELHNQMEKDTLSFLQEQIDSKRRISDLAFKLSVCEIDLPEREIIDSIDPDLQLTLELIQSLSNKLPPNIIEAVQTLDFSGITLNPPTCAALLKMLRPRVTIEELILANCNIGAEGIQGLVPMLHKCRDLRLQGNNLGDSGLKLLCEALRNPECKIQRLELDSNNLTSDCTEDLASALSANRSLTGLHLVNNKLGDSGVKSLCEALRNPECKIQRLWLAGNNLGDSGVKRLCEALRKPECKLQTLELDRNNLTSDCTEDLVSALGTNHSLTRLYLDNNNLGDSGVKRLCEALRNPECKLQTLGLGGNNLEDCGVKRLCEALRNPECKIQTLWLGGNNLGDSAVKQLFEVLSNLQCKIQSLWLNSDSLTAASTKDLASALNTNTSLTDLNLGNNELGDSGVKRLCEALRNPEGKIQTLRLYSNSLTDDCTDDLVSALSTSRSLRELGLRDNSFTDASVPALRRLILTCTSLEWIGLEGNSFSSHGQSQLVSVGESIAGLTVTVRE